MSAAFSFEDLQAAVDRAFRCKCPYRGGVTDWEHYITTGKIRYIIPECNCNAKLQKSPEEVRGISRAD